MTALRFCVLCTLLLAGASTGNAATLRAHAKKMQLQNRCEKFNEMHRAGMCKKGRVGYPVWDPVQLKGEKTPWMSKPEFALWDCYLSGARTYFEFGAGGSTAYAAKHYHFERMHSTDLDPKWVDSLVKDPDVSRAMSEGWMQMQHVDIGDVGNVSYPVSNASRDEWPRVSKALDEASQEPGVQGSWDVVLVDGRFRVACFLRTLLGIGEGDLNRTAILIHDYDWREKYHVVESFAVKEACADSLAVFRRRPGVSNDDVRAAIKKSEYDPDF